MGFKRKWQPSPPELVALFDAVLPRGPGVERRKMFGYPCAFVNGNMFTGLHEANMIVRLSQADRDEMSSVYGAESFKPFGPDSKMTMREYIAVPRTVLGDAEALGELVMKSIGYTSTLPPKHKL